MRNGNGDGDGAHNPGAIEARGVVVEIIAELEARARGRGNGNGSGGGNGGNDGGDGDGENGGGELDFVWFARLLIPGLRRMADLQSDFTLKTADAMLKALSAERVARQDEAMSLAQRLLQALRGTADTAERVAGLADRVFTLEHQLAALRPADAGGGKDEGGIRP